MYEDDETESEETEAKRDPRKWSWISFWSNGVAATGAFFHLIGLALEAVSNQMDSHRDYKDGREKFAERAALEIEALTKTPEESRVVS